MNNEFTTKTKKMSNLTLADIFEYLNNFKNTEYLKQLKPLNIFILRSYTAELLEPILKLKLILEGYNPTFYWGHFGQYTQEIIDISSHLYTTKPNLVLWLLRIEDLIPHFFQQFGEKNEMFWLEEISVIYNQITKLLDIVSIQPLAQIIIQNFHAPITPYWGIYNIQKKQNQTQLIQELNHKLSTVIEKYPNVFLWDYDNFITRKGADNLYDSKQWYIARNPFKQTAYIDIAEDLMRYILGALGIAKKCIVLDLDNTLWGGIIGEDGLEGIALGNEYPGNCYMDLQRELLKLYHRGIILTINSKNDENDALEVINKHPNMLLKLKHFAAYQINWQNKAHNLEILAHTLNINIDSMIFLDDNPAECELIKQQHPQCTVIQIPNQPYLIPQIIRKIACIENLHLTEEDKQKGKMYQAQTARSILEKSCSSLSDFLTSLKIQIEIKPANQFSIPRIAQLTQKTNQFNLTTRRYTEADIISLNNTPSIHVFSVTAKDHFGDHGIIGVFILKFSKTSCLIDTFLLSCRVIERTIEQSMLAFIAEFAKQKKASTLIGEFIPTTKNKLVENIYTKLGLIKIEENKFVATLDQKQFSYSPYIKSKVSLPEVE